MDNYYDLIHREIDNVLIVGREKDSVVACFCYRDTGRIDMPSGESSGFSGGVYTCSKLKLDSLFLRWFSLPESQELVRDYTVKLLCTACCCKHCRYRTLLGKTSSIY